MTQVSKIGKRGTIVIPARLRRRFGLEEGSVVLIEEGPDGVVIRPAAAVPLEIYSPERRAELLLENTIDPQDYAQAQEHVRKMGLDPDAIAHERPR